MHRESAFKNSRFNICGLVIRQMTLRDFLILDAKASPFVTHSRVPTIEDLAEFLWILSPQVARWHDAAGWRKPWLIPSIERVQAYVHGRRIRKLPCVAAAKQCFEFMEVMFQDCPGGTQKGEAYQSYLGAWCDTLRSEYKCSEEEIWSMPLPKLFGYLRAMDLRKNPDPKLVNRSSSEIRNEIVRGINQKKWTAEQVMSPGFTLN